MSKWRKAAKIDANQKQIVATLRQIPGVSVEVGHDDLLIGVAGKTLWYEIKNPDALSKKTGLILDSAKKPSQIKLEKEFNGHYRIVTSFEEIWADIQEIRNTVNFNKVPF